MHRPAGPIQKTNRLHQHLYGRTIRLSHGGIAKTKNLRQAERCLPDNIYTAVHDFKKADWTTKLFGEDVKQRYIDLKIASAGRCPRLLGTFVKAPEIQYHHEIYNQYLWNQF